MNELVKQQDTQSIFHNKEENKIIIVNVLSIDNFDDTCQLENTLDNGRYKKYNGRYNCPIDVMIITDITDHERDKYLSGKHKVFAEETSEYFYEHVLPVVKDYDKTWVYNILDGISEADRILLKTDTFVLLPDIIWTDHENINNMHYLAFVIQRDILSARDLRGKHINLLKDIDIKSKKIISATHNIDINRIRSYIHYHPSTWHLHIHFDIVGTMSLIANLETSILVHNVINNLTMSSTYYRDATLLI
jgi:m7GpppX diphosphatase